MAQHDYDIANQSGANFRSDLNNALDAIVSNNSGSSAPSTTFAYEWWIDTSNNLLKLRNSANNAWITLPLSITADNATSGALTVNGNLVTTGTFDVNGGEIILDVDGDTSITSDTDDQIDFRIGAVDVATLTNSHLVLKGTTPKITIGDGGAEDTALIFNGNAQDFHIGLDDSADDLVIGTGSTVGSNQKIILEDGGNVGVGTTTPSCRLHLQAPLTSDTQSTPETILKLSSTFTNTGADGQAGCGARIEFEIPDDETNPITGAAIAGLKENGDDSNAEAALAFYTSQNDTTLDEAMRIDSTGRLLVAKTSTSRTTAGHEFHTDGFARHSVSGDKSLEAVRTTSDGEVFEIFKDNTLKQTMGTASNSIFSDEKVKKDIKPLELGLDLIKKLNPKEYRHIVDDDDSPMSFGLIAQEFEKSLEEVGVEKNSTYLLQHKPSEEATNSDYWLDYQKLTPVLIKAIKELEERVKTLEG